jgi:hypothetical protein
MDAALQAQIDTEGTIMGLTGGIEGSIDATKGFPSSRTAQSATLNAELVRECLAFPCSARAG